MDTIVKISVAAAECCNGGGGVRAFFPKMVDALTDYDKTLLANTLCLAMPDQADKFHRSRPRPLGS